MKENTLFPHMPCVKAVVCIPSYRRPKSLDKLLHALEHQQFDGAIGINWSVVIIDNDPEKSAKSVYESFISKGKLNIIYISEPRRGLSYVRNAAIDAVSPDADYLCFIDDDEFPCSQWLSELIKTARRTRAQCVFGAVYGVLPNNAPQWIKKGKFFDKASFRDGEILRWAGSGNLMLSCEMIRRTGLRFDNRLNFAGGEDTFFLFQAKRLFNIDVVGSTKAIVYEDIPNNRLSLMWMLKRRFRIGNGLAIYDKMTGAKLDRLILRAIKGMLRIVLGLMTVPAGLLAGKCVVVSGLRMIASGLGTLFGLCGYVYEEYALHHLINDRAG